MGDEALQPRQIDNPGAVPLISRRRPDLAVYDDLMKVREVLRRLRRDGWYEVRHRGSHRVMRHPTKRGIVVVAGNLGADMKAGTLGHVLKQAGLNEDETESGDAAD